MTAQIDDGADPRTARHFLRNGFEGRFIPDPPFHIHPLQSLEQFSVLRKDLTGRPIQILSRGEIRLRRCGEYHGRVIAAAQRIHCAKRGGGQTGRQALGLVKYHNAACNVVELSADGRAV